MKNLALFIGMIIFFEFLTLDLFAQFVPASVTSTDLGVTVEPRFTGNDYYDDGTDTWEVSVYDDPGDTPAIHLSVSGGAYTSIALDRIDALDPDVCLVQNNSGLTFAIVVYFDPDKDEFIMEVFNCHTSGPTLALQSTTVLASGKFSGINASINIDGENNGNFIIIWCDTDDEKLYVVTGDHNGSAVSLNNSGTPVNVGSDTGKGHNPDVCFYGDGTDRVTYTYIFTDGDLYVDTDDFSDLASGNSSASNVLAESPTNTFYYPRIACPKGGNGSEDDWTVVVEDHNSTSDWYIKGYNSLNATITGPTVYNIAAINFPKPDLSYNQNHHPVVAYTDQSDDIFVGWTVNDVDEDVYGAATTAGVTEPSAVRAEFPIVIKCDDIGKPVEITASVYEYWEVPESLADDDYADFLSLSGRYGNDELYITYWQTDGDAYYDMLTKVISSVSSTSDLRESSSISLNNNYSNPYEMNHLFIYDISGKLILNHTGTISKIETIIKDFLQFNTNSLYISEIRNNNNVTRKKIYSLN